jgi:hypothetical protein
VHERDAERLGRREIVDPEPSGKLVEGVNWKPDEVDLQTRAST